MQLRVVDAGPAEPHLQANLISYVINEQVAIDAGALGLLPLREQQRLRAVFVSHSHADHIATLPMLIDNVYCPGPECLKVYGHEATLRDLQHHIFNDRIWPDVLQLAAADSPFVEFQPVVHGQTIDIAGLRITPFEVNHTLPSLGFVIEERQAAVAVVADTAPCDAIWEFLADFEQLRAVFLEISFPNRLQWLADVAKHLTPNSFLAETRKLATPVTWYITHTKLEHSEAISCEVAELQIPNCKFAMGGECYRF